MLLSFQGGEIGAMGGREQERGKDDAEFLLLRKIDRKAQTRFFLEILENFRSFRAFFVFSIYSTYFSKNRKAVGGVLRLYPLPGCIPSSRNKKAKQKVVC